MIDADDMTDEKVRDRFEALITDGKGRLVHLCATVDQFNLKDSKMGRCDVCGRAVSHRNILAGDHIVLCNVCFLKLDLPKDKSMVAIRASDSTFCRPDIKEYSAM